MNWAEKAGKEVIQRTHPKVGESNMRWPEFPFIWNYVGEY